MEIIPQLAESAGARLRDARFDNVHVMRRDGYHGYPEVAPCDGIMLAAATPEIPPPLLDQLRVGGVLVAPVGEPGGAHRLRRMRKHAPDDFRQEDLLGVRFVPFTRESP